MNKQYSNKKPDFFLVLVLLVIISFGLTVALQVISSEVDQVADSQPVKKLVSG